MRVSEIHAAVEELLGESVAYSSVKEALSAHARGGDRRFRNTRRGCYELVRPVHDCLTSGCADQAEDVSPGIVVG